MLSSAGSRLSRQVTVDSRRYVSFPLVTVAWQVHAGDCVLGVVKRSVADGEADGTADMDTSMGGGVGIAAAVTSEGLLRL